jgi:hypothetical protein
LRNQLLRKELLAVLCSVFWFWFLSFSFSSLFVSDSFGYPHNSEVAGLWHEIRELSRGFDSFNISFVKRDGNKAAHTCAKLLLLSAQACTWTEAFPTVLLGIASSDCNPVLE